MLNTANANINITRPTHLPIGDHFQSIKNCTSSYVAAQSWAFYTYFVLDLSPGQLAHHELHQHVEEGPEVVMATHFLFNEVAGHRSAMRQGSN